jgi:hypothetical protein
MFPYGMDRVGSVPSCNSLPWVVMVSFGIHSDQNLLSTTWWWTVYTLYIYENIGKYVFSAYTYVCISGILLWVYNGVLISCLEVNKFPNPPVMKHPRLNKDSPQEMWKFPASMVSFGRHLKMNRRTGCRTDLFIGPKLQRPCGALSATPHLGFFVFGGLMLVGT